MLLLFLSPRRQNRNPFWREAVTEWTPGISRVPQHPLRGTTYTLARRLASLTAVWATGSGTGFLHRWVYLLNNSHFTHELQRSRVTKKTNKHTSKLTNTNHVSSLITKWIGLDVTCTIRTWSILCDLNPFKSFLGNAESPLEKEYPAFWNLHDWNTSNPIHTFRSLLEAGAAIQSGTLHVG